MIGAETICTDEACAVTVDVVVESLTELELRVCDGCGCSMHTVAVWEAVELRAAAPVTQLRRRPQPPLAA
jgi:NMD protein affecting ribosome stability and mRNA decay